MEPVSRAARAGLSLPPRFLPPLPRPPPPAPAAAPAARGGVVTSREVTGQRGETLRVAPPTDAPTDARR